MKTFGTLIFDFQRLTKEFGWASGSIIKSVSNGRNDKSTTYDIIVLTAAHNLFDDGKYFFKDHRFYVAAHSGQHSRITQTVFL